MATQAADLHPMVLAMFDPSNRADPYRVYRQIREMGPVTAGIPGLVVFARHADCSAILTDPRAGADRTKSILFAALAASGRLTKEDQEVIDRRPFLLRDPPDHTRLRRLVSKAFTPRVVEGLRMRIRQLVDEALDAVANRGRIDVVSEFAYPVPVAVISELLGVPTEDHETFQGWSRDLTRLLDPDIRLLEAPDDEERRRRAGTMALFREYFLDLIERRRSRPGDDLLSQLVAAEEEGDQLTEEELVATCVLLLVAGHETTVNLIANGILALLMNPEQRDLLRERPELARGAVEEALRFDPPVQVTGRIALEPLDIGGAPIPQGGIGMLLLAAANRDPAAFPDPDPERFDITRDAGHHLAFGMGPHFCLGAPLARLEGQIALSAFVRRVRDPLLADEPLRYKEHFTLRGLAELPVEFSAIGPRE